MPYLDQVEKWILQITGRTLDQHAADPVPCAAHLPHCAEQLRYAREHLLHAVDALRTQLINADDLTGSVDALTGALEKIAGHVNDYVSARTDVDRLIGNPDRLAYVATHPAEPVHRSYVTPGDTVPDHPAPPHVPA